MFKAELNEGKILKDSISAIASIIDIGCLKVDKTGINLSEMDSGHVCFVHFELKKDEFDLFDLKQPLNFIVDMKKLNSILERVGPSDTIRIEYNEKWNRIALKISNDFPRTFFIDLLEEEVGKVTSPDLDFSILMKFSSSILRDIIRDVETIKSNDINFEINENNLVIKSYGDIGGFEAKIKKSEMTEFKKSDSISNSYSSEFLSGIISKGSKLSEIAIIETGDGLPIKIVFHAGNLKIIYMLVPFLKDD